MFSRSAAILLASAGAASAQLVNDGNMDSLALGTPPDEQVAAGAWAFPANYITALVAEPAANPTVFTIVASSSFSPTTPGNSLRLINPAGGTDNFHLPNLFTSPVTAAPGVHLRVAFDIWVDAGGGGGSVYVGGDNGGGGFSNASDRGPQLTWEPTGALAYTDSTATNIPVATYTPGAWQHVLLDIDTDARTYDLSWAMAGNPLSQVGNDLPFRTATPATLVTWDRFSFVQFGATNPVVSSAIDNVSVQLLGAPCYPNCDGSTQAPILNVLDFNCFLNAFSAGASYANCDNSTQAPVLNVLDFNCFLNAFSAGCP